MDSNGRKRSESSASAGGWRSRAPLRGNKPPTRRVAGGNRKIQSFWARFQPPSYYARQAWGVAKRLRMAALAAVLVAAAAGVTWLGYRFLTTSKRFAIATIEIEGNQKLSNAQVLAAMPLHLGDNIFKANVAESEPAIRQLPWVSKVDVSRHLPNTIRVRLRERVAAAVAVLGDMYFIDSNGQPFKRIDLAVDDVAGLPIISGIARAEFIDAPAAIAKRLRAAIELMTDWRSNASRPEVAEISCDHDAFTLRTATGTTEIHLGSSVGLTERLATFDAAWAALSTTEKQHARELRLDYQPDHLTVAFAKD
jgi:cell division septal protein FtsQ